MFISLRKRLKVIRKWPIMLTERLPYTFNILDYSYLIKAALLGLHSVALHLESEPKKQTNKQTNTGRKLKKAIYH